MCAFGKLASVYSPHAKPLNMHNNNNNNNKKQPEVFTYMSKFLHTVLHGCSLRCSWYFCSLGCTLVMCCCCCCCCLLLHAWCGVQQGVFFCIFSPSVWTETRATGMWMDVWMVGPLPPPPGDAETRWGEAGRCLLTRWTPRVSNPNHHLLHLLPS